MKPAPFDYVQPPTLEAALDALAQPDAKILAGSQSLGPMLNFRLARPSLLVDITRIPELSRTARNGASVTIGACVTHAALEDHAVDGPIGRLLATVAGNIAYRAVRTRGTIGGSLAHADPAADWLTALTALGADLDIRGPRGARRIKVEALMLGAFSTVVAADEIVTDIVIPDVGGTARWGFKKFCRKVGEFADAMCAVFVDSERGAARLVLGATDSTPILLPDPERLIGDPQAVGAALADAGLAEDAYLGRIRTACVQRTLAEARPVGGGV